jgi:4-hydroxybenzoyl-CoA thioesterase
MSKSLYRVAVSFGDCDPAGIVFYPNIFRWADASFHNLLRQYGGHAALCRDLQSQGIGVIESSGRFLSPLRDGDQLEIESVITDWGRKTLTLVHIGRVGPRGAFEVKEVRCLFKATETAMVAAEVGDLRARLQNGGA